LIDSAPSATAANESMELYFNMDAMVYRGTR
jgi:hypothetical protein